MCDNDDSYITWSTIHYFQIGVGIVSLPLTLLSIYLLTVRINAHVRIFRYYLILIQVRLKITMLVIKMEMLENWDFLVSKKITEFRIYLIENQSEN